MRVNTAKTKTGDLPLRVSRLPVGVFGRVGVGEGWSWTPVMETADTSAEGLLCPHTITLGSVCEGTPGFASAKLILA